MGRTLLAILAVATIGALPGAAAAMPVGGNAQIKVNDAVDVAGTKIACYAVTADGKSGIVCFKLDSKGPAPGTFGVGIARDGLVTAYKINAKREPQRIFKRPPQSASSGALDLTVTKTIRLSSGKTFHLKGTNVFCQIVTISSGVTTLYRGIKIGCFRADGVGALPKSNGVVISNKFVGAFPFKANRKPGTTFFERRQPTG